MLVEKRRIMLKSEKIIVNTANHKNDKFGEIVNYVKFLVRHTEFSMLLKNATYSELREEFDTLCADKDLHGLSKEELNKVITNKRDLEDFWKYESEFRCLKSELDNNPIKLADYEKLSEIDRTFITLQAHTNLKSIQLDESFVTDANLAKMVSTYYSKGSMKSLKDSMKSMFYNAVGKEGELFYAVKLAKSDFTDEITRNFLANFRGTAGRTTIKKRNVTNVSNYHYLHLETNKKVQIKALTDLFAVVLDSHNDLKIVKPETAPETVPETVSEK